MTWISTAEQLPNVERFLYISAFDPVKVKLGERRYFDSDHIVGGLAVKHILYWMPLPALPEV